MKDSRLKRNIEGVILGLLLLIPCFSVLGRVLYTQWNHNAKDSYSDYYYDSSIKLTNTSQFVDGVTYFLNFSDSTADSITPKIAYSSISIDWGDYIPSSASLTDIYAFQGYSTYVMLFYWNANHESAIHYGTNNIPLTTLPRFNFVVDTTYTSSSGIIQSNLNIIEYVKVVGTLDNAFDYSLQNIVDKYGTGNINFLNWFGNLMFNNPSSLLYCQFANLYLNYCLYINVGYLIYYFFTFFIRMIRKLLDSFIDRSF